MLLIFGIRLTYTYIYILPQPSNKKDNCTYITDLQIQSFFMSKLFLMVKKITKNMNIWKIQDLKILCWLLKKDEVNFSKWNESISYVCLLVFIQRRCRDKYLRVHLSFGLFLKKKKKKKNYAFQKQRKEIKTENDERFLW